MTDLQKNTERAERRLKRPVSRHRAKMTRRDRFVWLAKWIATNGFADVMNAELVDEYAAATGMSVRISLWGANYCRQLGADLSEMQKLNYLERWSVGLGDNWFYGMPKWVWAYGLGKRASHILPANICITSALGLPRMCFYTTRRKSLIYKKKMKTPRDRGLGKRARTHVRFVVSPYLLFSLPM